MGRLSWEKRREYIPDIANLQIHNTPVGGWRLYNCVVLKFHKQTIWVYKKVHPYKGWSWQGAMGKKKGGQGKYC